jgi:hypothetical protein
MCVAWGMNGATADNGAALNKEHKVVTIGAALAVVIVGVLIAVLANSTIGMIVAAVGVVGLILALVTGSRARV